MVFPLSYRAEIWLGISFDRRWDMGNHELSLMAVDCLNCLAVASWVWGLLPALALVGGLNRNRTCNFYSRIKHCRNIAGSVNTKTPKECTKGEIMTPIFSWLTWYTLSLIRYGMPDYYLDGDKN